MAHNQTAAGGDVVGLKLPVGVVGTGDVRKLGRDLEQLEDTLRQIRLRTNAPVAKLPRATRALEEFAATNRLNLLLPDDRQRAQAFVGAVAKQAPVLHMGFAAEPSRKFTTELILWLRSNLEPNLLLSIGLEPNIAAGCVVRTTNKQYDFSLRSRFDKQAGLLAEKLRAAAPAPVQEAAVVAAPPETANVG